jgi:hypothetical protein
MVARCVLCVFLQLAACGVGAETVDFVRDVQPIFQRACYRCHGAEKQKSEYRLDVRDVALNGGELYPPNIIPGDGDASPLLNFVAGDGDLVMPPEGPALSVEEVATLRAWIEQGAVWPDEVAGKVVDKSDWWAWKPLSRPDVPGVDGVSPAPRVANAIDQFIGAKMQASGLRQAPRADRRTLIRRVYFDLTGLPPSPEEVDAFVEDDDPEAYARLVDRLLASPRYGERWARHWMDAAHFAETHGHDQDRIREHAWPYRDYLISSFNADKPYSRFVQEQVAGDALFPEDPQATIALGFLAAGPWDESSLRDIFEDTLDRQIARYLDRDDMLATVMNNVSSVTVQCARCHDHKFDPISQEDYYSLQAVFAGVDRANRVVDHSPDVKRRREELLARQRELGEPSPAMCERMLTPESQREVEAWEKGLQRNRVRWTVLEADEYAAAEGSTLTKQADGSLLSGGPRPERDTYTVGAALPLARVTAIRVEVLADESLPLRGPGRQDNGNLHLSEFEVFAGGDDKTPISIAMTTADFNQAEWGVERAIDGNPLTAWGIYPQVGQSHEAVFEFREALAADDAARITVVLKQLHGEGHLIGRVRLSVTDADLPVGVDVLPADAAQTVQIAAEQRTEEQRLALALHFHLAKVARELASLPPPSLVYAAASQFEPDGGHKPAGGPRPIHLLHRGEISQPREPASPGALSCVTELSPRFAVPDGADESLRRVALARWLTDRQNPLTWRSIVNRVWHHHFGVGIVNTPNDFGHLGGTPSHPELLDWLAVEFRDGDQGLKQLHRLIVTSETYRQTSRTSELDPSVVAQAVSLDSDNRLLWRMNRLRLDSECIHDAVLVAAGRLDLRMGGPSDRQFGLNPGIHVTPVVDYAAFDVNSDAGRRRSVYRFLFRTLPDPLMDGLDCPSGDQITPARINSVTVQQALALWNSDFVLQNAGHWATRLSREAVGIEEQAGLGVRLAFGREATEAEQAQLSGYGRKFGLANMCRLLFNANEFVFVD